MSVAGILSSAAFGIGAQLFRSRTQQSSKEFQQLGQDLQSGNLTAAQSDFAKLQQLQPQTAASSSNQRTSSITEDFKQLSADLKAGNTTAAQQDFTKLQQDFQSQGTQQHRHHHHDASTTNNAISQIFTSLGQALQSGNLAAAQQAYATLQQDLPGLTQAGSSSAQSVLSVSA